MQSEELTHFPRQISKADNDDVLEIESLVNEYFIQVKIEDSPQKKQNGGENEHECKVVVVARADVQQKQNGHQCNEMNDDEIKMSPENFCKP
jgi:hypothetical protein